MEKLAPMLTNAHLILTTVTRTQFAQTQRVHTRVHAGMDIVEMDSEIVDALTPMSALRVSTTVMSTLTVLTPLDHINVNAEKATQELVHPVWISMSVKMGLITVMRTQSVQTVLVRFNVLVVLVSQEMACNAPTSMNAFQVIITVNLL